MPSVMLRGRSSPPTKTSAPHNGPFTLPKDTSVVAYSQMFADRRTQGSPDRRLGVHGSHRRIVLGEDWVCVEAM